MVLMSFETLIPFVIEHNALIIQGLVALILFFVAFLAVRNFMRGSEPSPSAGANLDQLEGTLKKLLEKANVVAAAPLSADTSRLAAEIETLRSSLAEKQDQIEQMRMAPRPEGSQPASAPGLSDEDKAALEAQVRDLQAKLSEYEIISEDIADLSFYKEENAKLQKQLESAKTAGTATVAAPAVAPVPETPPPAAKAPVKPPVPEPAAVEEFVDPAQSMVDALMDTPQEDLQRSPKGPTPDDEDLLKEFADAVSAQGGKPAIDEAVAESLFDVERMTQEAGQLQKIAASAPEPDTAALDASLDAERLALEAASMEAIKPEDAKLMGDFEDFMKKGGA